MVFPDRDVPLSSSKELTADTRNKMGGLFNIILPSKLRQEEYVPDASTSEESRRHDQFVVTQSGPTGVPRGEGGSQKGRTQGHSGA